MIYMRMTMLFIVLGLMVMSSVGLNAQQPFDAKCRRNAESLATAEREFSATAVKEGYRDSFIRYFAEDGINFGPDPQLTKAVLTQRPRQTGPRTIVFSWTPMFIDVSAAGDLGVSTGPVLYRDVSERPKPLTHGIYFSVWQKQGDGSWKVAIDMGASMPQAVAPMNTSFKIAECFEWTSARGIALNDHRTLDHTMTDLMSKADYRKGYTSRLADVFWVYRAGVMPVTERTKLAPVIRKTRFEFIDGKVASSNDLAFTYGKYATATGPDKIETGYYVHAWRRNRSGNWKLIVDVQNQVPNDAK